MTAPGNDILVGTFALMFALTAAYACGRLHAWYRQTNEREEAFQRGYDKATHSMYRLNMSKPAATVRGSISVAAGRLNAGPAYHSVNSD